MKGQKCIGTEEGLKGLHTNSHRCIALEGLKGPEMVVQCIKAHLDVGRAVLDELKKIRQNDPNGKMTYEQLDSVIQGFKHFKETRSKMLCIPLTLLFPDFFVRSDECEVGTGALPSLKSICPEATQRTAKEALHAITMSLRELYAEGGEYEDFGRQAEDTARRYVEFLKADGNTPEDVVKHLEGWDMANIPVSFVQVQLCEFRQFENGDWDAKAARVAEKEATKIARAAEKEAKKAAREAQKAAREAQKEAKKREKEAAMLAKEATRPAKRARPAEHVEDAAPKKPGETEIDGRPEEPTDFGPFGDLAPQTPQTPQAPEEDLLSDEPEEAPAIGVPKAAPPANPANAATAGGIEDNGPKLRHLEGETGAGEKEKEAGTGEKTSKETGRKDAEEATGEETGEKETGRKRPGEKTFEEKTSEETTPEETTFKKRRIRVTL